ncbi:DUF2017 domain-containing protein [Yinghuangia aomiensis]
MPPGDRTRRTQTRRRAPRLHRPARSANSASTASTGAASTAPSRPRRPPRPRTSVLARLLPDAYRDDAAASAEFRRYTENDLRLRKVDNARTVRADIAAAGPGARVVLDEAHAQAWLGALNDLRLALGTNLGVTEDLDLYAESLDPDDPRLAVLAVYHWLGVLQESLVEALLP